MTTTDEAAALIEAARYEISVFERPSAANSIALLEGFTTQQAEIAALRAEVARLRLELKVILLTVEDEGYKVTVGQQPCKHTKALNEIHEYARAALSPEPKRVREGDEQPEDVT